MRAIKNRAAKGTMEAFAYLPYLEKQPSGSVPVGTFEDCVDSKTLHGMLREAEKSLGLPEYGIFAFTVAKGKYVYAALTEKGRTVSGHASLFSAMAEDAMFSGMDIEGAEDAMFSGMDTEGVEE